MAKIKSAPILVQKYLKGMDYPATKEKLIEHAKEHEATNDVIMMLQQMKAGKFNDPADVTKALGK